MGLHFIHFALRWMNCLLMREFSLKNIIRLWDTYMSEGVDGFSSFHLYVCVALLTKWSKDIKEMDFQSAMTFLQNPPSHNWGFKDIELILSEAYVWKSLFHNSTNHFSGK